MTWVRRPWVGLLLALMLSAGTLAGCTTARNLLDNGNSQCFRVLPAARAAVGSHAKFSGVLLMKGHTVDKVIEDSFTHPAPPGVLHAYSGKTLCVAGYTGSFDASSVQRAWAAAGPGPYRSAAVVVNPSNDQVVVTLLYRHFPRSLGFKDLV